MKKYFTSKSSGFTLIELMVVVVVMAILATIILMGITVVRGNARDVSRMQIMNTARALLEGYYGSNGYYPSVTTFDGMAASGVLGFPTGSVSDPGCGGAKIPYVTNSSGAVGPWRPCGTGAGISVSYQYSPSPTGCTGTACTGFVLTLVGESKGTTLFKNSL